MSLELWGHPARVVIQFDIGDNRTVNVPVEANIAHAGATTGELRIPLRGKFINRVKGTLDDVAFSGLDR